MSDPYQDAVVALSPTAFWALDEASTTTASDTSGNGHDFTFTNGTPTRPAQIAGTGRTYSCGFATAGVPWASQSAASWSQPTGSFTVMATVKPTLASADVYVLSDCGNTSLRRNGFTFWLLTGQPWLTVADASTTVTVTGAAVAAGSINMMVGVYNGSTLKLYLNGYEIATAAASSLTASTLPLYLNLRNTVVTGMASTMQDVAFWNGTALTAQQVNDLYRIQFPIVPPAPYSRLKRTARGGMLMASRG